MTPSPPLASRLIALLFLLLLGAETPGAAGQEVDPVSAAFDREIRPILEGRCLKCHGRGKYKGGLSLENRAALLRGGEGGPAAEPGDAAASLIVERITEPDPLLRMPANADPLPPDEVETLRAWIDRGMPWPDAVDFGFRRAPIAPRSPEIPPPPAGLPLDNPIDRFIARFLADRGVAIDWEPVSDRAFYRRASLDLVGLLPSPEDLDAFDRDRLPDKRDRLVARLLANRRSYADHWLTFWNDALRNEYRGTGFIDDGRSSITRWLYRALFENLPYDRFARELVSPVPGSGAEGFTKGIIWRGVVNASQTPPVQAAQNVSQVFLATNLKCASCHDSFVNHWTLDEAYALAAVFSEESLEIHRCDQPVGRIAEPGFIYPELGAIDPDAPRVDRMARLAELLTSPDNGRFARTIVNRLWAQLMGRGLVEPLDDLDREPWSQDLLDWLAADLVSHGYDLKHTLALIASSGAYQLPADHLDSPPSPGEPYSFRGPLVKRMTAEQFLDAFSTVTGSWPEPSGAMLKVDGRGQGGQLQAVRAAIAEAEGAAPAEGPRPARVEASWIWNHADALKDPGGTIFLRKVIRLDQVPDRALIAGTCDNELVLLVNGTPVARGSDWSRPVSADVTALLRPGENVIAAEATNWPDPARGRGVRTAAGPNPAAFIAWVGGFEGDAPSWGFGTDETWLWSSSDAEGWALPGFDDAGWQHAVSLPLAGRTYPGIDLSAALLEATGDAGGPIRAALAFSDPLSSALGRPSREQVVTRRDPVASTIQALELTNGEVLSGRLAEGAAFVLDRLGDDPDAIISDLFLRCFGRPPAPEEREISRGLLGDPAAPEGVEDLLWALLMLPEFQLIP
ncbi:DUF1549 domain-containing protein [Tautonia sociabilis]|uniref:DUF1549 domain-containing protein n=1 Tax=Tautonia sociabilis TaxID=2080755 RepID=A0A432MMG9_9BACT|nr:DUF1549 domain-containing protein [Tautonia sociabilis]RUL88305.1 DUF1549 domain-containing protein [Tautonia sociabilis]